MRPRSVIFAACLLALGASACGKAEDATPAACFDGADAYLAALAAAPGEVRLEDETPIGDCLAENQNGGELATVGAAMVEAATQLNAEARANPEGPAPLRLGYLLGAADLAAEQTEGIHADLIRRLIVAGRYSPEGPPPPVFLRAYREGFDAGQAGD